MNLKKASLFFTGFLQVSLVSAQTYLVSRNVLPAVFVVGFGISLVRGG